MKIGEKLKLLRKIKGYTQEELADKLFISRKAYANLENDSTKIDLERLNKIATIYEIELEDILNLNEGQVFTNCFNNNINGFLSSENVYSGSTNDEREFYFNQIKLLIENFNIERNLFLEALNKIIK